MGAKIKGVNKTNNNNFTTTTTITTTTNTPTTTNNSNNNSDSNDNDDHFMIFQYCLGFRSFICHFHVVVAKVSCERPTRRSTTRISTLPPTAG